MTSPSRRSSFWQRDSDPTVDIVEQDSRSEYSNNWHSEQGQGETYSIGNGKEFETIKINIFFLKVTK